MTLRDLALTAALALLTALPATAQGFRSSDVVTAELRPGWRTESGTHMAALHLRLAEGWKTYWRVPGEAGIPPRFDWSGSDNLYSVRVHWPRPEVFHLSGVRTLGFATEMVLPLEFELRDPGATARVAATVDLGVCETVCVPVSLRLEGLLPTAGQSDRRINAALAERPVTARSAGLSAASCTLEPGARPDRMRLTAQLDMPRLGRDELAVFELADEGVWIADTATRREGGRLLAEADLILLGGGGGFALDRSALRITVLGDGKAVELTGCPAR